MAENIKMNGKHLQLLQFFAHKKKSTRDAVEELGIPYPTLIKYVRELVKSGHLAEVGFREGNTRFLTTIRPGQTNVQFDPVVRIFFRNELQTIEKALESISPAPEVDVRQELIAALVTMARRAELRATTETPGGMSPNDVHLVLRRTQVKLSLYVEFIDALLNAAIWVDDADNHKRLGWNSPEVWNELITSFTRRHMAEDKGALEK